ncbi:autotransporter outer membrane beta-barrel domain-containing protein [Thalassovita mangrovi]|nr:autotransporter outer membrane beta-barrel domain-containing protein [Thalassovita mangrovi]
MTRVFLLLSFAITAFVFQAAAAAAQPTFTLTFSPSAIGVGGTSVATYTITNGSPTTAVTDLAFTHTLSTGLQISSAPDAQTTCYGQDGAAYATLSAPAGGTTIAFSSGSLPASSSCTTTVNVTGATPGSYLNTTSSLTSSAGSASAASATLTVDSNKLSFSKTIVPDTVSLNGTSTMTYTIDNPISAIVSGLTFSETLPSGVQIASPSNVQTDCTGGTLTAPAGGSSISLTGAFFMAAGSCTVTVDIQGTAGGSFTLTSSELSYFNGSSQTAGVASAEFTVNPPPAASVSLTKVFSGDPVAPGGTVTLGFTLYNTNDADAATNIGFTDDLEAMLSGATMISAPSEPCGAGSSISGSGLISFSNGSLAARAWCSFDVTVQIPSGAGAGTYTNTTSTVSATVDGASVTSASGASDTLDVGAAPLDLQLSFTSVNAGDTTTGSFTLTNPNVGTAATNGAFSLPVPLDGLATVTSGVGTNICGSGSFISVQSISGTPTLVFTGGNLVAGGSCSFDIGFAVPASTDAGTYPQTTSTISATIDGATLIGNAATGNLTIVSGASPLLMSKTFAKGTASISETVGMTFSLTNSSETVDATNISFTDDLESFHTGAVLASVASNSCGGSVSGTGTGALSFSGGTLNASGSCEISVTVTLGINAGTPTNTTSDLTASLDGGSAALQANTAASDTITILSTLPLTASFEILESSVPAGGTATARYTITNPNGAPYDATGIAFSHPLYASLSGLLATSLPATPCGAGSALSGSATMVLSGGNIAAGGSCTFDVTLDVPGGAADGDYPLPTNNVSYTIDGAGVTIDGMTDILTVGLSGEGGYTFELTKAFGSEYVLAGSSASMTLTLENLGSQDATSITLSDNLASFLSGTSFGTATSNSCGGTLTGEGGTTLTLSNVSLTAGANCSLQIPVDFSAGVTLGTYTNTTSEVTGSTASGAVAGPEASASIEVRSASLPTFSKSISPSTTNTNSNVVISYSISNPVGGIDRNSLAFTDNVATDIPGAAASVLPGSNPCGVGSSVTGTGVIALTAGVLEAGKSCQFDVTVSVPTPAATTYTSTTSDLTDGGLFVTNGASDTLTVNPLPPSFSKVFAPDSMAQGDTSTLTFTVDASLSTGAVPGLDFTDNLPTGVVLASPANGSTTCTGGTLTAVAGGSTVSYSGGLVNAASTCTVSVDVTSVAVGAHVNTSGTLTSDYGTGGTASDTLTITAAPAPGFTKVFGPDSMVQGDVTTLTFTIDNGSALIGATSLAFFDNFPAGMTVAATPNGASTCTGGTLAAVAGASSVAYSGGTIAAGGSCTVSVDVTSTTVGAAANTSGDLTSSLGNSGTASDTLTVTAAPAPGFAKVFGPDRIVQGGETVLSFTIDNTGALVAAENLAFTDIFPAGMTIAATPGLSTTCTGTTITADAATDRIVMTAGSVAAETSCTVEVSVTTATAGTANNVSGDLTSSLGNSGPASASLGVREPGAPDFTKVFAPDSIAQGGVSTLTFTIDNSASPLDATDLDFSDSFPAGLTVAAEPNAETTCSGGTLTAAAGADTVSYSGGTAAGLGSCTVTVDVTSTTVGDADNTTGDLTSSLGNSGSASATLSVTAADVPGFAKAFTPDSIVQGGVSTLTFTIDNSTALIAAADLDFTDSFPAGMTVAAEPNAETTCSDGTLTAAAGAELISYAGGTVAAGESCDITVDVTSATVGDADNTSGELSSSLGNSGTASATLSVLAADVPGFAKAFTPDSISQGDVSTLTFTIDNSVALVAATDLAFTDSFPAGMTVAADPNAETTCSGGTLTAAAGAELISYAGGTVAAGESCDITVDVTSATVGDAENTSGELSSSLGNSGTASATLSVTAAEAPIMTQRFDPETIAQGGKSTLIVTIDNSANFIEAGGLAFTGSFPENLTIANPTGAITACGGTLTATAGESGFSFSGGTAGAQDSCEVRVDVTAIAVGSLSSVLSPLSSTLGTSEAPASIEVTVIVNTNAYVTFVQQTTEDGTFGFASDAAALNFSIATAGGSGTIGPIEVPAGSYTVTQSRPTGVGNETISCSDDDSSADVTAGQINLELANFESVTCTISSIASLQKTVDTIHNFLHRRNNLLLSNQPNQARRIARLNSGGAGGQQMSFATGDIMSMSPLEFDLMSIGSGNYRIATSSQRMRSARTMALLAHNPDIDSMFVENTPWDIWFEGMYNEFEGSAGASGHFALGYMGADYVLSKDLLIGALVQFDSMRDTSATTDSTVDGHGWMVGPYVTARLAPNLIFDGRFALGRSTNDISPFNTYTDTFETKRFLVDASLSGQYELKNNWIMSPNFAVSYIRENQLAYVDTLGVPIPSQKVWLGQLRVGPNFSRRIVMPGGDVWEPRFTVDAIYNFSDASGATLSSDATTESDGLRARIEGGFNYTDRRGAQLSMSANYDGIGQSDYESYGLSVKVTVPLQ